MILNNNPAHIVSVFISVIFLSLISCTRIYSQFSSYVQYDMDKGMPSNTAYYLMKDSKGYLWITTDRGVVRYDGYGFTTYTTRDGMSDNEAFEAFEDDQKRIWFSTLSGIPGLYVKGSFVNLEKLASAIEKESTGPTYRIIQTPYGIYILNRRAIYRFNNNRVKKICKSKSYFTSIAYHSKSKLIYVVLTGRNNLLTIDPFDRTDSVYVNTAKPSNISKLIIKNDKLIYTAWKSFSVWDIEKKAGEVVEFDSELLTVSNSTNDSTVLIGSVNNVVEFNLNNNTWKYKFIDQPGVTSIYSGADRSYWTTSLNTGLNYFGNEKVEVLSDKNVLPFKYVSLVRKVGNRLLICSDKFRLCLYNLSTQKVEYYFDESGNVPGRGFASTIRVDTNGDIYVSFRVLLLKMDKNYKFTRLPLKQVSYDIIHTPKYYFGSHTDFVSRRPSTANFLSIAEDYESMSVNSRRLFIDTAARTIFAYGTAGIFKINTDSFNRVRSFQHIEELKRNISSIVKLGDNFYAIGSTISGVHFLKDNQLFSSLSISQGLSSNYVSCITKEDNELWIGTNHGINVLTIDIKRGKYDLKLLGKKDGIFADEINDIYLENDTVYATSPTGLFYFKKTDIVRSPEIPVLNIDYIRFNGQPVSTEKGYSSTRNSVRIKYTGISYNSMGNMIYRYKLSPVDDEWHYTTAREIEYPALRPHSYTLTIQCKGIRGSWSNEKLIQFEVLPTFWQRKDVQVILVFLILALMLLIIRFRIRKVKKQSTIQQKLLLLENEKLEITKNKALQEKEIVELEQQALRLHMNPHFIFNAINAIQGFYAGNEVDKAKQFISYFSRLLRLILETSKEKFVPVSTEVEIIRNYLELFLLRFEDKYDYQITIDENIDKEFLLIPPMVVQPFVENAVLHGISPMKEKGKIVIDFKLEPDFMMVSITDNGIGRKKSAEMKMFSQSKSTGIKVTQTRLKLMDEEHKISETVEIIDINDEAGSTGTQVILRIPLLSDEI